MPQKKGLESKFTAQFAFAFKCRRPLMWRMPMGLPAAAYFLAMPPQRRQSDSSRKMRGFVRLNACVCGWPRLLRVFLWAEAH